MLADFVLVFQYKLTFKLGLFCNKPKKSKYDINWYISKAQLCKLEVPSSPHHVIHAVVLMINLTATKVY